MSDIDRLIADAFEVVIYTRDRKNEAQIGSHQLVERKQLHDPIINFHLELIDGRFLFQNGFGQ